MEKHTNNEGMKFKVGDRVRVLDGSKIRNYIGGWVYGMDDHIGKVHTICEVGSKTSAANGYYLKDGDGYVYDERGLKLDINNKIVITTDGITTLARLYDGNKVIKSAEAKCSPDDEFDFLTGAKIAFERLTADDYDYDAAYKLEKIKAEIEKMQEEDKKADETAIKITGATYEVIGNSSFQHHYYSIGERIKLVYDDGTDKPMFSNDKGMGNWVDMRDVKLENPKQDESEDGAFFNGKAVYLETESFKWSRLYALTKGETYTFVDGKFIDDNGVKFTVAMMPSELKSQGFAEIKE